MTLKGDQETSTLEKLSAAQNLNDFINILGITDVTTSWVSYTLYKISEVEKYEIFEIDKKDGGKRIIKKPILRLKILQKNLMRILEDCQFIPDEIANESKRWSHGFRKNCSIVTNAKIHVKKRYVLNFDIKDFFPSFNFGRVRGFFISKGLNDKVATIIAQIACHKNELPQGSPCSPIISNLIAHEFLDKILASLARKHRCDYSRYADDITFSTNQREFPEFIAIPNSQGIWKIGHDLEKIINDRSGFKINHAKTRMRLKYERQTVTGLVVNEKVNIRRPYYKLARAMVSSLFEKGTYSIPSKISPVDVVLNKKKSYEENPKNELEQLEGILSHVYYVKKYYMKNKPKIKSKKKGKEKNSIERLYEFFLYYKYFISLDKEKYNAVAICEGSTDVIHISEAIKKYQSKYPDIKLKFIQNSKIAGKILNIDGGEAKLVNFAGVYKKIQKELMNKYKNIKFDIPIIIIMDNDDGTKGMLKHIRECRTIDLKKTFNKKRENEMKEAKKELEEELCKTHNIKNKDIPYFPIDKKNLYLVKLPHVDGQENSCIEDLHEESWRKKAYKKSTTDEDTEKKSITSKSIFAITTKKEAQKVDFSRFIPLLDRIDKAIKEHYERQQKQI